MTELGQTCLWFPDGTIIVQAGTTRHRVYGGLLQQVSHVFRDMLQLPQPSDLERVEGCPVVHLQDSPDNVAAFLFAIFIPDFFPTPPHKTTFAILAGCLHMSHKYDVQHLLQRSLSHLSSHFPTTLTEWPSDSTWETPTDLSYLLMVVKLARLANALWVLPMSFYLISSHFCDLGIRLFQNMSIQGFDAGLSSDDQEVIIRGYHRQIEGTGDVMRFLVEFPDDSDCETREWCYGKRTALYERISAKEAQLRSFFLARGLEVWEEESWEHMDGQGPCDTCIREMRQSQKAARQAFWDQLPSFYQLPSWRDLDTMKRNSVITALEQPYPTSKLICTKSHPIHS